MLHAFRQDSFLKDVFPLKTAVIIPGNIIMHTNLHISCAFHLSSKSEFLLCEEGIIHRCKYRCRELWMTLEDVHIITGQMHPCMMAVNQQGVEPIRDVLAAEANMKAVGKGYLETEVWCFSSWVVLNGFLLKQCYSKFRLRFWLKPLNIIYYLMHFLV